MITSILLDLAPYLAALDPLDVVFHASVDVKGWIGDCLHTDLDVALLDVHDCLLDCLGHLEALQHDWQPSSAEAGNVDLLAYFQALPRVDEAHLVQFIN